MAQHPVLCRLFRLTLVLAFLLAAGPGWASFENEPIESFFGVFEGRSISSTEEGLDVRDLNVTIAPRRRGFNVTWTTVTYRGAGSREPDRRTYSVDFEPSGRPAIFGSAMRQDMFGNRVPYDPLRGDPYVWSRIRGKTLTVFALLITDDGGYEMQTYDRTLSPDGLHLEFSRIREGLHLRFITADLVRLEDKR